MVDVVEYESSGRLSTAERQSQDMRDLGRVLLSIAFRQDERMNDDDEEKGRAIIFCIYY